MGTIDLSSPNAAPKPSPPEIFHIASQSTGLQFEWHVRTRQVYMIKPVPGSSRAGGVLIADQIPTAELAKRICSAWVEGWKAGRGESLKPVQT